MEGVIILGNTLVERRACDGNEESVKVGSAYNGLWAIIGREIFYTLLVFPCVGIWNIFC